MGDGDDCGSHVPGEPHEGAQGHEDAHPEQVQMVAGSLLQDSGTGEILGIRSFQEQPFCGAWLPLPTRVYSRGLPRPTETLTGADTQDLGSVWASLFPKVALVATLSKKMEPEPHVWRKRDAQA